MLTRWFPAADVTATEAKWLDVILYSREQLAMECAAMPSKQGAGEQVVQRLRDAGVRPSGWLSVSCCLPVPARLLACRPSVLCLFAAPAPAAPAPALPLSACPVQLPDAPWGIISIKAQDEDHETPMQVGGGRVGRRRRTCSAQMLCQLP